MKKISSASTAFHKKVFPTVWFGFLALFLAVAIANGALAKANVMFLVVPCVMAVFGYFLMKRLVWDLVDEVYDCGDSLLIRNRGRESRISLGDIINVSSSEATNPPRITLKLVSSSATTDLGSEVTFSPARPFTLNPFAKIPIAEELIVRVDRARSARVSKSPVSSS
jgi:hypothetical protein